MSGMMIEPATRRQAKGRMLFFGPSGSGKTVSALRVAAGMGGRIVLIDTENRSSEKYAGLTIEGASGPFEFEILSLAQPYSPQRYIEALSLLAKHGCDVCVIDSISHEWQGTGGVQEIVDAAKGRFGGNSQAAWSVGTPLHNKFLEAILAAPFHVVATARSKTEWVAGEDERGRQVFKKAGHGPIQRDTIEYEFDVTMLLDSENSATVVKTRANPQFPPLKIIDKVTEETGALFLSWLSVGDAQLAVAVSAPEPEAESKEDDVSARSELIDSATLRIEHLQNDFGDYAEGVSWSDRMTEKIKEWWGADAIDALATDELKTLNERLDSTRVKKEQDKAAAVV